MQILRKLLFLLATLRVAAAAVAPGDESQLCTETLVSVLPRPVYPTNVVVLMDTWNYENLLPPHDRPVWQQVDRDSNNAITHNTNWIQNTNNLCRQFVEVCGFSIGPQDNWLITQLISRTVDGTRLPQVNVQIEFQFIGCNETLQCQRLFEVYVYETSTVDSSAARNIGNYRQVGTVAPIDASGESNQNHTVEVTLITQHTSFYFAVKDVTSCIVLLRMIVFYNICPMETSDFALRPETLAPVSGSPPQIATQCVPNAGVPGGGDQTISICTTGGIWVQVSGQGCTCNAGFFPSGDGQRCIGCFARTYFSEVSRECQTCPGNSNSTEQGETECPCFGGFYRAQGEEDLPCELPPSPPRNIRVTAVTENSISVSWDPPASLGGRDEGIFYNLTAVEENSLTAKRSLLTNGTSGTLENLLPGLSYQVYVIAENGITEQVPDRLVSLAATMSITTDGGISATTESDIPTCTCIAAITVAVVSSLIAVFLLLVLIIISVVLLYNKYHKQPDGENYYSTVQTSPQEVAVTNATTPIASRDISCDSKPLHDVEMQENAAYKTLSHITNVEQLHNTDGEEVEYAIPRAT